MKGGAIGIVRKATFGGMAKCDLVASHDSAVGFYTLAVAQCEETFKFWKYLAEQRHFFALFKLCGGLGIVVPLRPSAGEHTTLDDVFYFLPSGIPCGALQFVAAHGRMYWIW